MVTLDVLPFLQDIREHPEARYAFDHIDTKFILTLIFETRDREEILGAELDDHADDAETHGYPQVEIEKHRNDVMRSVAYIVDEYWRRYGGELSMQEHDPSYCCAGFNLAGKIIVLKR